MVQRYKDFIILSNYFDEKCKIRCAFWRFQTENGRLNVYFKHSLLVFGEKCVSLQRRAYAVPSKKDARMGGTLHNVKSVIDALSIGRLKLPHSIAGQWQC